MGQHSAIEWTDHTFNPWWGCKKVSPGCEHCYAETWALRYGFDLWGNNQRRFFSKAHWNEPLIWNRKAIEQKTRARVFCASMSDVFEDNPILFEERRRLWSLISKTDNLDWLLLTKRPENMKKFVPYKGKWPINVWAMATTENQELADYRIPFLLNIDSEIKGLSIEPMLGPVNIKSGLKRFNGLLLVVRAGQNHEQ